MLAQIAFRQLSLGELFIAVICIAACVAIVAVALQKFGIAIPEWVQRIFWIVVVACVAIIAVRFVLSM